MDDNETFEFTKDGKVKIQFEQNGKKVTLDGTYTVDEDSVKFVLKAPGGKEEKRTLKVKNLTDKKLVIGESSEKTEEFKRVEKAKDK